MSVMCYNRRHVYEKWNDMYALERKKTNDFKCEIIQILFYYSRYTPPRTLTSLPDPGLFRYRTYSTVRGLQQLGDIWVLTVNGIAHFVQP